MRSLMVALAWGGQSVLLSSLLLAEVQDICDRVGVISDGRLLREATVAELRGATTLRVRGVPLDAALATAMRVAGDDAVHLEGEHVVVTAGVDAPNLTRALVADGIDVHEIVAAERTLEEVFFEMTSREMEAV
jgi:ABC-type multidrug transport system ATPase subunit